MEQTINVTKVPALPPLGSPAGFYEWGGSLYAVSSSSASALWVGQMNQMCFQRGEPSSAPLHTGISEDTLLKAMAIANGSEWTKGLFK